MKKKFLHGALWLILLLPYFGLYCVWKIHKRNISEIGNALFVLISKQDMTLSVYDYKGKNIVTYPIACGKNPGNKEQQGDLRTPEGVFSICDIQDSSGWIHDFGDGNGEIEGAYGPHFIRLLTPGHKGIGIHGTHQPDSLQTRITEGCIRMTNEDVKALVKKVKVGDVVVITPAKEDANQQ
jgi:lipoprotein-anchoring transpeptidase ErfK/SrfK